MRRSYHLYFVAFLFAIFSFSVFASEANPVNDRDKAYFTAIRGAVLENNKDWLANEISFPIKATVRGQRIKVGTKEDFLLHYDEIINAYVKDSVRDQNIDVLFKDWKGLTIGRGAIWFGLFGPPDDDGPLKYSIVAINNEPPPE